MGKQEVTETRVVTLLHRYLAARRALKTAGVLRSDRTIQSDYAEWLITRRLRLQPAGNAVQAGYDATDTRKRRYQIKGRVVRTLAADTSFDSRSLEAEFDFLLGAFFDRRLKLLGVIRVSRRVVEDLAHRNKQTWRLRWNRETRADPRIVRLYWSKDEE